MNRSFFYWRLALTNLRKNSQTYLPYLLTCLCTVMMFYMVTSMSFNAALDGSSTGVRTLESMLNFGMYVTAIFSAIFLFYTNSFLVKRRKKEFGLYTVLGLEKKHLARVLCYETLLIALASLLLGLAAALLFSRLLFLLLMRILQYGVMFQYAFSREALFATMQLFGLIFGLLLLFNILQVAFSKPIELLRGSQMGERDPKTRWLIALGGLICLTVGYYLAITVVQPVEALLFFFVAVILVILGTYGIFIAGSIALLKRLRASKRYFYKTKHFIGVSGMLHRMKANAAGLASICILSTCVLVTLSTTIAMYVGMEDILRTRFPRDIAISATIVDEQAARQMSEQIELAAAAYGAPMENQTTYLYQYMLVSQYENNYFTRNDEMPMPTHDRGVVVIDYVAFCMIPLSQYNQMQGTAVTLAPDELLLYSAHSRLEGDRLTLQDQEYRIKEILTTLNVEEDNSQAMAYYFLILPDEQAIITAYEHMSGEQFTGLRYYYGFNTPLSDAQQEELTDRVVAAASGYTNGGVWGESLAQNRVDFLANYGGLFFLGLFLGTLFLLATVLIIYYKQITEGLEDRGRFRILRQVGMDNSDVKRVIHSQVLKVFFLPLITAVVHICFAFPMIVKLLSLLNLTNVTLFAVATGLTILVFALFYGLVYLLTARTYYRLVA